MTTLGYTEFEQGYRHGKRDYAVGLRNDTLLAETNNYSYGYRYGLKESEAIQANWLKAEGV